MQMLIQLSATLEVGHVGLCSAHNNVLQAPKKGVVHKSSHWAVGDKCQAVRADGLLDV